MRLKEIKMKRVTVIALLIFPIAVFFVFLVYIAFWPNVKLKSSADEFIYIRNSASFNQVMDAIENQNILKTTWTFKFLAIRKNYPETIKPGRYKTNNGMNNNALINLLRSGKQTPVNVIIKNFNTPEEMAGSVSQNIEADSAEIVNLLYDRKFCEQNGINHRQAPTHLLANTYRFFWNTNASMFLKRMFQESEIFWTKERTVKAKEIGLSKSEVVILASIVEKETAKTEEMQRIAGVYMNRLNHNWPLQADPTIVFASTDFKTNRVTKKHIEVDSPYNTYLVTGLPPGPICIPSPQTVDAVLNYENHRYFYFVAKDDFSGYHQFSRTLDEHNLYAFKYRKALKKLKK